MNINQKGIKVKLVEHSMKTPTLRAGFFAVLANALRGQGTRALAAAGPAGPAAPLLNAESTLSPQESAKSAEYLGLNAANVSHPRDPGLPFPARDRGVGSLRMAQATKLRSDAPDGGQPLHGIDRHEHSAAQVTKSTHSSRLLGGIARRGRGIARRGRGKLGIRARLAITQTCFVTCVTLFLLSTGAQPALALTNPERHYEMVTPPYKAGYGINHILAVALDGEAVAYSSPGSFEAIPGPQLGGNIAYLARRGASGWTTTPVQAPGAIAPLTDSVDITPSLGEVLVLARLGQSAEIEAPGSESGLLVHDTTLPDIPSAWETLATLAPTPRPSPPQVEAPTDRGETPDLCHIVIQAGGDEALLPEAVGEAAGELYEFNRGCEGAPPSLKLLALNNAKPPRLLRPQCDPKVGDESYRLSDGAESSYNAISTDGTEIFFTSCVAGTGNAHAELPHQLFVRLAGDRTLEVSRPLGACVGNGVPGEVPCAGASERASADFAGASQDGTTVYFTTTAALVPGDQDTSNNLYMARIGCPAGRTDCMATERVVTGLSQVSHGVAGGAAEVVNAVRIAPDGSRAYFVARGALVNAANAEGRAPTRGAENLYVYDAETGSDSFIAELCGGKELSGSVVDSHCPAEAADTLATGNAQNGSPSQTAGANGRFLVFATYAQLVAGDTNAAQDVYRYDAETGSVVRVSSGENGFAANNNASTLGATIAAGSRLDEHLYEQYEENTRAVSEDGSRIVFTSAAALSPAAANGLANAYEWHEAAGGPEGRVSLISTGTAAQPVEDVVISPSGRDVFFKTSQGLAAPDTDGAADIYDARLGEGFPSAPGEQRPCQGDACQGPLTNPAPLLVPGSVSQAPGENLAPPPAPVRAKAKPSTRAQLLAKALKACGRDRSQRKRVACEKQSRKAYGGKPKLQAKAKRKGDR